MNKDTWIGKVVSFDSQADQVTGQGWGWRYKVRIMGDYSEQDGIEDRDVVYALSNIHISDPTRQESIAYAVFCLKK